MFAVNYAMRPRNNVLANVLMGVVREAGWTDVRANGTGATGSYQGRRASIGFGESTSLLSASMIVRIDAPGPPCEKGALAERLRGDARATAALQGATAQGAVSTDGRQLTVQRPMPVLDPLADVATTKRIARELCDTAAAIACVAR